MKRVISSIQDPIDRVFAMMDAVEDVMVESEASMGEVRFVLSFLVAKFLWMEEDADYLPRLIKQFKTEVEDNYRSLAGESITL